MGFVGGSRVQAAHASVLCKHLLGGTKSAAAVYSSRECSFATQSSWDSADTLLHHAATGDVVMGDACGATSAQCSGIEEARDHLRSSSHHLRSSSPSEETLKSSHAVKTTPAEHDASMLHHAVLPAGDGRTTWMGPTCFAPPVVTAGLSAMVLAGLATMSCSESMEWH